VTDTKGASHTATSSVIVGTAVDRAPPSVTLVALSQALPGKQVVVTADAVDNVGIASLTFTVDNANPSSPPAPYQRTITIPTVAALNEDRRARDGDGSEQQQRVGERHHHGHRGT
jgi:hypothetical protein